MKTKKCKQCGNEITTSRYIKYCSTKCRNKYHNKKNNAKKSEWVRKRADKKASISNEDKVQCLICKRWYVQVGTHIFKRHGITAREYREHFDLEVKKGIVPNWYREMKAKQCIENGTAKNVEKSVKYRFKKGQKGVGVYKRSPITLEKLRNNISKVHKMRKQKYGTI